MQTFLPDPSFELSARCLDRQRLGKQRVEVLQLLRALHGQTAGWTRHPAALMWRSHEQALVRYGVAVCEEWLRRGYQDTCLDKISAFSSAEEPRMPEWLGQADFHLSHQSNLVRKKPEHYRTYFPLVDPDLPYVWPVRESHPETTESLG